MEVTLIFLCFNGLSTREKINIMGPIERSSLHVDLAYKGPFECKLFFAKIAHVRIKQIKIMPVNNEDAHLLT